MTNDFYYAMHGMKVQSELALTHSPSIAPTLAPDCHIRFGRVDLPAAATQLLPWARGTAQQLHANLGELGTLVCMGGTALVFDSPNQAPAPLLEAFVHGVGMPVLMLQRGLFPLHGAFVCEEGGAIGLLGDSGEGKSTLAAGLSAQGFQILTDDTGLIGGSGELGGFRVATETQTMKLWAQSATALNVDLTGLARVEVGHEKYYVPIPSQTKAAGDVNARLRALYVLESLPEDADFLIEPLTGIAALAKLRQHTSRSELIDQLKAGQSQLDFSAALVRGVPLFRFGRPRSLPRLGEAISALQQHLKTLGALR